ncbi:MAG: hypothetical protein GC184_03360 [Rhizobiales bacterium]|nr:hypothetical protein [Hyphomicrobiales bacterium]
MSLLRQMSRFAIKFSLLSGLLLAFTPAAFLAGTTGAQAAETIGPKVGAPLQAAQNLAKSGKYAKALQEVNKAEAISGKTPYEAFVVYDFQAYLNGQLGNSSAAAKAYEKALATGKAPAGERAQRMQTIATLYYQARNYSETIAAAQRYQKALGPDSAMQTLIAQSYYLSKDYPAARDAAQALVRQNTKAGKRPDEAVLQIALASAFQLKDYNGQKQALLQLVNYYPSDKYWSDLVTLVSRKAGNASRTSYEFGKLKLARGMLSGSPAYIEMGQLAIQLGLPGEAESLMKTGMQNGTLGGENKGRETRLLKMAEKQAADDRPMLAKTAATADEKAELAEAYASYGMHDKALPLYAEALKQGGLSDKTLVLIHQGESLLATGRKADAAKAFARAEKSSKFYDLAVLWNLHARKG